MGYEISKIYPWLYSIYDPLNVFCYLIEGDNEALLYDTGYGVFDLPKAVSKITSKPVTVLLGHGHVDHACGAYQFDEAYLHKNDFEVCQNKTSVNSREYVINMIKETNLKIPESFDNNSYLFVGTGNLRKLEINKEIDLGGLSLKLIEMTGHTKGSVGILVKEKQTLLVGDATGEHVWLFLNESAPVSIYTEMLEKLCQLDFSILFSGHSNCPKPKSDIQKYIRVAKNATIEKAVPCNIFEGIESFTYQEDGAAIVINSRTLYNS